MTPTPDTHATTLATALRPSDARGGAALVTGSTQRLRRALLDDATRVFLTAHPRWLVVRLSTSPLHGALTDALSSAVDDALHAAHAPGALHEDQGAGLASRAGSWLYRARAAGLDGVALVIDDLDAWLDARGTTSATHDVAALLSACRRGPLSVLASTRAASASGAAALPAELVALFEATVSLGAAPLTITRDPGTLVAALSGRSFNLGGLQASLAGWLDLPPPAPERATDDTLIVFSSPLAAPPLPIDPLLTLDWVDAPAASVAPPPVEVKPSRAEDLAQLASGLRAAVELGTALRRARQAEITDAASAERCFLASIVRLPLGIAAVSASATTAGVEMRNLAAATHAAIARFDQRFEAVRRAVDEGREAVLRAETLPEKLAPLAARIEARSTAVVVLPGLQADLWHRFKTRVLAKVTGLSPAGEEGVAWSFEAAVEHTAEGIDDATPRREHRGSDEVTRVGAYAAIGVTRDAALDELEASLVTTMRALCGGFAGRTAVLFAGERASTAKGRSAFETLTPYGLYTYAARTA